MTYTLSEATPQDIPALCELINLAYRGQVGWTTEQHLVAGDRIKPTHVHSLLALTKSALLIYKSANTIDACIHIAITATLAHIGTFAVNPSKQGSGIGNLLLNTAEEYAEKYGASCSEVAVLEPRLELISYYQRRGYIATDKQDSYPVHLDVGNPTVDDLRVIYLQKLLTNSNPDN